MFNLNLCTYCKLSKKYNSLIKTTVILFFRYFVFIVLNTVISNCKCFSYMYKDTHKS